MAFTQISKDGAIAFNWPSSVTTGTACDTVRMINGEILVAPRNSRIQTNRWLAYRYHKTTTLALPGVMDIAPYAIDWYVDLDDKQSEGFGKQLVQLNERTRAIAQWRQQLSEAERDALISGTFATVSGISAIGYGVAFIGDLFAGGIPWATGLLALGSAAACGSSVGALEAHAKRGDAYVRSINSTMVEVLELGRALQLPATAPHQTPIIQSACTGLAQAFGWKDELLKATQNGIADWLNADLRFSPS